MYEPTRARVAWRKVAKSDGMRVATTQANVTVLAPPNEAAVLVELPAGLLR